MTASWAVAPPDGADRLAHLMVASAGGDDLAFAQLYDLTSAHVFGVIRRVLLASDLAAEVTQEVYLELWRQAARFEVERGSVLALLTTMAHRRAVDRVRSRNSEAVRDDRYTRETTPPAVDQVWTEVERGYDVQQVRGVMSALTPLQLEAVVLTYFGGYSGPEVARLLSVPLGTVKTRLRDGLIRLRTALIGADAQRAAR